MKTFFVAVLAFVLFIMWCVVNGTKVEVSCGPSVSTPPVVVGLDSAGKLGDSLRDLVKDGPTPLEVLVFVKRVMNLTVLIGDVFGAHLNGKSEPRPAEGLRKAAGDAQQKALAGCCVQDNPNNAPQTPTTPPNQQPWDPKNDALQLPAGSPEAVARNAARRYFPPDQVNVAVAIAGAESTWTPTAVNHNSAGNMVGLWQINDRAHPDLLRGKDWRDPNANAWMAYQVWSQAGRSWRPWSTFNNTPMGYRHYLHNGPTAALGGGQPAPTTPAQPACTPAPSAAPNGGPTANLGGPSPASFDRQGNPRTVTQAVDWLFSHPNGIPGRPVHNGCEGYMNLAFGLNAGYMSAAQHWDAPGPRTMGMSTPPRGALVFWRTSTTHVALSIGGGNVASTDFDGETYKPGVIGIGPITAIDKWAVGHGGRLGWRAPNFKPGGES